MHAVALTNRLKEIENSDSNKQINITINSCHPGVVNTSIMRGKVYTNFFKYFLYPIVWFCNKTPNDGAQTPLYLALSTEVANMSGLYFK